MAGLRTAKGRFFFEGVNLSTLTSAHIECIYGARGWILDGKENDFGGANRNTLDSAHLARRHADVMELRRNGPDEVDRTK